MDVLLALESFGSVGCYISSVKLGHTLLIETFTLNNRVLCDIHYLRQSGIGVFLALDPFGSVGFEASSIKLGCKLLLETCSC